MRGGTASRKVAPGDIGDGAFGSGYWEGWHDIHLTTRHRRGRKRARSSDYADGYEAGRIDGAGHPYCPEWDEAHRKGCLADLPEWCPWNPTTAKATPDWQSVAPTPRAKNEGEDAPPCTVESLHVVDVGRRHLRQRADILPPGPLPPSLGDERGRGTQAEDPEEEES